MQVLMIMEDLSVHHSKINVLVGCSDKRKVAKIAKCDMKSSGRRTLADISNIPQQPATSSQDNNPQPTSDTIKEYIEQLQKEKTALVKLLADKNRIIEQDKAEGHKLRVTLQKFHELNSQLAQSNSQMLAELNSVKDREKVLRHEIGCKNGLIIAKKLELKEMQECTVAESNDDKHHNTTRRHKSKSLAPSVTKVQDNDMAKNKRLRTRRQSSMFKLDEPKPTIDDDLPVPPCPLPDGSEMKVNDSTSVASSSKEEESGFLEDCKPQEHRRTSVSRPLREAAKKVPSYKEIKVNMKMRRSENKVTRKSWIY